MFVCECRRGVFICSEKPPAPPPLTVCCSCAHVFSSLSLLLRPLWAVFPGSCIRSVRLICQKKSKEKLWGSAEKRQLTLHRSSTCVPLVQIQKNKVSHSVKLGGAEQQGAPPFPPAAPPPPRLRRNWFTDAIYHLNYAPIPSLPSSAAKTCGDGAPFVLVQVAEWNKFIFNHGVLRRLTAFHFH